MVHLIRGREDGGSCISVVVHECKEIGPRYELNERVQVAVQSSIDNRGIADVCIATVALSDNIAAEKEDNTSGHKGEQLMN